MTESLDPQIAYVESLIGMPTGRGWIGFDLDGTLAEYEHWQGMEHIGPPVPPMVRLASHLIGLGWTVKLVTARFTDPSWEQLGRLAWEAWSTAAFGLILPVTASKDFAMVWLFDDRASNVVKNTGVLTRGPA
jgi:hypothetical protein